MTTSRIRRAPTALVASALLVLPGLMAPAHASPADLDGGFGAAGIVATRIGPGDDAGAAVAVQPDGRIVVAGAASNGTDSDFAVVRYEPGGGLDPSFGPGGTATTSFGTGDERAFGVAVQPDGRIVVAGKAGSAIGVARYLANGTLDSSFDGDGRVLTSIGSGTTDVARAVAIAPDGRIVVGGETVDASGSQHKAFAVRYNADGSLDPSLDGDGRMLASNPDSAGADVVADAVAVLGDGRIVLAGGTGTGCAAGAGDCDIEVSRWTRAGGVDVTMDTDGESTTRIAGYDRAHAVAMQADGKTVAAGVSESGGTRRIAVVRYTGENASNRGNLDKSFGSGGIVTTNVGADAEGWGLALQGDGRIVVSGTSVSAAGAHSFVLVRYLASGALDAGFGSGGVVTTSFPSGNADGRGIAVGPDGRWAVAGSASSGGKVDIAVARYVGQSTGRALSATAASVVEGSGPLTFTVKLSSVDSQPVSVHYATEDGSATSADYTSTSGTLTFGPGEQTKTVTVPVTADSLAEGDETVELELTGATPDDTLILGPLVAGTILDDDRPGGARPPAPTPGGGGYRLVASDGGIFAFGSASFKGSTGDLRLNQPIVAMAPTPSGNGYWLLASDGGIFAFGDATFRGSTGNLKLAKPIVGMASTPSGNGYWLVASDGGIFAFGDASFFGSTGNVKLARPIVAIATTPTGNGYWMVASDGGIFAFGDATFRGSTGNLKLAQPIVGMASTPTGRGYWMVASDGGMFAFGDATFRGSTGNLKLARPIVAMAATKSGQGYWLVASDGGIFAFGDAGFFGSTGNIKLAKPIVGMAAT